MYNEKEEIIAGTVGTVGTAAGIGVATAGASAATLTTGLASIGAIVGGGMATGIVMTAAAPVVVGWHMGSSNFFWHEEFLVVA